MHNYPKIDYIEFETTNISDPLVFVNDGKWISNYGRTGTVRKVIHLNPTDFSKLITYWYIHYQKHRWIHHKKYQRALMMYQHYNQK